jgi:N-carbamoyl-L-amino-acid hydrolase
MRRPTVPTINPERLIGDLQKLRSFGAHENGVVRLALSPVDIESRRWLVGRMNEAGLDARIDGIGSVYGRSRRPGPALVIGSHTDTQPTGGWLDGAMGVIFGLEIARAFRESNDTADLAIDVASWIDEEGTFSSYIGSRSFVGEDIENAIATAVNREGQTLVDALRAAGIEGTPRARFEPGRHVAYLEPHIEQGGRLEAEGKKIGVVTTIVGIREMTITFLGQRNHAGTTPMSIRKDAGVALINFAQRLDAAFRAIARPETVWTIGRIELDPGSFSIVPGKAEMMLQFRDADSAILRKMEEALAELVSATDRSGPVRVSCVAEDLPAEPSAMDLQLQEHIAAAAEAEAPGRWIRMPSGAGHDAQVIAGRMPSAMLFVPSIGGISHDFAEDTSTEDIVRGCRVAAEAAARILRSHAKG